MNDERHALLLLLFAACDKAGEFVHQADSYMLMLFGVLLVPLGQLVANYPCGPIIQPILNLKRAIQLKFTTDETFT